MPKISALRPEVSVKTFVRIIPWKVGSQLVFAATVLALYFQLQRPIRFTAVFIQSSLHALPEHDTYTQKPTFP